MPTNNKVLFILRIPPPFGGGEIVSEILYNRLKNKYSFLLFKRANHSKEKQAKSSFSTLLHGLAYVSKAIMKIETAKPKCIYIGLPKSYGAFARNAIIIRYAVFRKKTVIAELHGMSFPFIEKPKGQKLFLSTVKHIKAIRVLGDSIGDYLRKNGFSGTIVSVDNGIHCPFQPEKTKSEAIDIMKFLCLGAISEAKGFNRVLEVAKELKKLQIPFIINVIGEWVTEGYKLEVTEKIKQSELEGTINFHGFLKGDKKWEIMKENNFLLHLSLFDGQPLAIIEALSLGIPVFAYNVGGIPEMLTHGQDGFIVSTPHQIAEIVKYTYSDLIYFNMLSQNATEKYRMRFTPAVMSAKIEKMILQNTQ